MVQPTLNHAFSVNMASKSIDDQVDWCGTSGCKQKFFFFLPLISYAYCNSGTGRLKFIIFQFVNNISSHQDENYSFCKAILINGTWCPTNPRSHGASAHNWAMLWNRPQTYKGESSLLCWMDERYAHIHVIIPLSLSPSTLVVCGIANTNHEILASKVCLKVSNWQYWPHNQIPPNFKSLDFESVDGHVPTVLERLVNLA